MAVAAAVKNDYKSVGVQSKKGVICMSHLVDLFAQDEERHGRRSGGWVLAVAVVYFWLAMAG